MNRVHLRGISLAWAVCAIQALITVIAALFVAGFRSRIEAIAALFGGGIAIAPTVYFALRVYPRQAAGEPAVVAGRFYRAEVGRFALTAVLFFLGVMLFAAQFAPLILTYMGCLLAYWLVAAFARID
jgi:ATP synthase protein I